MSIVNKTNNCVYTLDAATISKHVRAHKWTSVIYELERVSDWKYTDRDWALIESLNHVKECIGKFLSYCKEPSVTAAVIVGKCRLAGHPRWKIALGLPHVVKRLETRQGFLINSLHELHKMRRKKKIVRLLELFEQQLGVYNTLKFAPVTYVEKVIKRLPSESAQKVYFQWITKHWVLHGNIFEKLICLGAAIRFSYLNRIPIVLEAGLSNQIDKKKLDVRVKSLIKDFLNASHCVNSWIAGNVSLLECQKVLRDVRTFHFK
jgi:hypothetical protein